jgi:ankyrin repeat protein
MSTPFRPVRALSATPRIEQQKKQARELLRALQAGEPGALERARAVHPRHAERGGRYTLSDAQLVLAREYGFASWPRLKASIEGIARPGPRQPYVADPAWYEARAAGLVEMHRGALPNALAQIRAWHPGYAGMNDDALAAAAFTLDDARLVYARQNGAADWAGLLARVEALGSGPSGAPGASDEGVASRGSGASGRAGGHARKDRDGGERDAFARAFAAIERRDAGGLRELVARDARLVSQQGTNGNTLLNLAVAVERAAGPAVTLLLEAGADPNLPNDRGWTPLHQAACTGDEELVGRLLEAGAVVTLSAHGDGGTPLAVALWWGRTRIAKVLAQAGVVPDNLRVRAGLDQAEELERFFDAGGGLVAEAGADRGFYRPHSGFLAWTPSDDPQEIVDEALCWAARNDAVAALEALAARGGNLHVAPCRGTPLMFAVAWRKPAAVRWLLGHGADANRRELFHGQERGRVTALHLAAQTDDPELVRMLLEHGADRSLRDENYDSDAAGWARHTDSRRALALLDKA